MNVIEATIEAKEKEFNRNKKKLEDIIKDGNNSYNNLVKEFNTQLSYVENNSYLNKDGKQAKSMELVKAYQYKAYVEVDRVNNSLVNNLDIMISSLDIEKLKNKKPIPKNMLTAITYVSSMVNLINNIEDSPMLKSVYDYIGEEDNFSEEVLNLLYIKTKSMLNKSRDKTLNKTEAIISTNHLVVLQEVVSKLEKYKYDYIKDYEELKSRFNINKNMKKHSVNLYMSEDVKSKIKVAKTWGR